MLESLELRGFKSFADARASFGPLSLIVGTNASGKSNLREALRFLHGVGLGYTVAEILGDKYGPGGVLQWRGIRGGAKEASFEDRGDFQLAARMTLSNDRLSRDYALVVDMRGELGPRVRAEALFYSGSPGAFTFHSHPLGDPLQQRGDHQLRVRYPRGGDHRKHGKTLDFSSAKPVLSQLAGRSKEPVWRRKQCQEFLDFFQSMRFLDLDPEAMRQPSQPGQTILGDRGENLSSVLQAICRDVEKKTVLIEWLRALTPMDATDFEFREDLSGRILVYLKTSSGFAVSAYSASDGTLRFLAMVAALLSEDSGRLYFFEELDNGIHPTRMHLLLQLIQQACAEQSVQVIGTSHNPALLALLDAQALRDSMLVYQDERRPGSQLVSIAELPGVKQVIESQDLGRLHQAGWLEDAAEFMDEDE